MHGTMARTKSGARMLSYPETLTWDSHITAGVLGVGLQTQPHTKVQVRLCFIIVLNQRASVSQ
jgi:hypothetical protein